MLACQVWMSEEKDFYDRHVRKDADVRLLALFVSAGGLQRGRLNARVVWPPGHELPFQPVSWFAPRCSLSADLASLGGMGFIAKNRM